MIDLVITFATIGKEHPATLEFVQECAERWTVPIVWLVFRDYDTGFTVVDYASVSRHREPFKALTRTRKYLPNPVTRFCTIDLMLRSTAARWRARTTFAPKGPSRSIRSSRVTGPRPTLARVERSVVSGGEFTGDGARFHSDHPSTSRCSIRHLRTP